MRLTKSYCDACGAEGANEKVSYPLYIEHPDDMLFTYFRTGGKAERELCTKCYERVSKLVKDELDRIYATNEKRVLENYGR